MRVYVGLFFVIISFSWPDINEKEEITLQRKKKNYTAHATVYRRHLHILRTFY